MDRTHQTSPPAAKSADQRSNARRQQRPARRHALALVQRKLGNRGYGRFLQAKLRVSHPQDQHEKEADRIADQVMRMTEPAAKPMPGEAEEQVQTRPLAAQITPLIQRQAEEEEPAQAKLFQRQAEEEEPAQAKLLQRQPEEEEPTQAKPLQRQTEEEELAQAKPLQRLAEEEEPAQAKLLQRQAEEEGPAQAKLIQRQAEEEEPAQAKPLQRQAEDEEPAQAKLIQRQAEEEEPAPPGLAKTVRSMNGGGQPLSPASRAFYEPRLGVDLGRVRVHSDSSAAQAAQSIQAKAFTTGSNIVFGAGQYAPETASGKHLLAHELTHVVQQTRPGPHSNPAAGNGAVQRAPQTTVTTTTASTSSSPGESNATDIAPGVMELKGKNDYTPEGAIAAWLEQRKQGKVRVKFGNLAGGEVDIKKSGNKYRLPRSQSIPLTHPLFQQSGEGNGLFHPHLKLKGGEMVSGYIGLGAKMAADPNEIGSFLQKNAGLIGLIGFDINSLPKIQNSLAGGKLELGLSGVRMTLGNVFSGSFSLTLVDESVTFAGDATVDVKGLAQGKLELQRSEQGQITGKGEVNTRLPKNFSGAVTVVWDGQTITGTGQIGYQGEKLSGTVTLTVMLQQEAKQLEEAKKAPKEAGLEPGKAPANGKPQKKSKGKDKLSVFGEGDLDFSFTDWLTGNAHVIVDEKGYVTIIGQITPQKEFELFPQKDYVKKLFKLEARASYGIPVVGNIFIFANVGMDAFAKLGPAKFYKIKAEGTYSTDPRKCKSFSIQGSLNISAAAGLRLRGEAGAGLEILSHDIKAGAGINGIAGIRGYAEATPVIGYREKPSEDGQDKKGEFFIRGDLEIAAQPFLGLSGDLFVEIDAPWWSPVPDKKWTWPLFNKEWPIGGSFGIGASMDYVFGSGKPPTLDFKKVDFSADKFLTDLYSDKASPKSGEGKEQAGKWKEKNSKEADPPSKNPPKGNGQPGQLEKEPKAKSKVTSGGGKKTTKEADPNAKTVEGKTVKQYQEEAKRKGKKPAGKEMAKGAKGEATSKAQGDKGKVEQETILSKIIEIDFAMYNVKHKLYISPSKTTQIEMASKRGLLSKKIGKVVSKLIQLKPKTDKQITDLKSLGSAVKAVQKLIQHHNKTKTQAPTTAPEYKSMISGLENYGEKYKSTDVDLFVSDSDKLRQHPGYLWLAKKGLAEALEVRVINHLDTFSTNKIENILSQINRFKTYSSFDKKVSNAIDTNRFWSPNYGFFWEIEDLKSISDIKFFDVTVAGKEIDVLTGSGILIDQKDEVGVDTSVPSKPQIKPGMLGQINAMQNAVGTTINGIKIVDWEFHNKKPLSPLARSILTQQGIENHFK